MAYVDQKMSGGKIVAIVIVALIHAVLGYAFVTGLAYKYVKQAQEKLNTFDVEEPPPPPPPEDPPPPPPDTPMTPPPVVSPPPIVANPNPPPVTIVTTTRPPPVYIPTPIAAPPAPVAVAAPPGPPVVSKAAGARGDEAGWVTQDDYPPSAIRGEEQGTSVIVWTINTQGRVENCRTQTTSGSSALDRAACQAISRRARYSPAQDSTGNPIATTKSRRVRWVLPTDR